MQFSKSQYSYKQIVMFSCISLFVISCNHNSKKQERKIEPAQPVAASKLIQKENIFSYDSLVELNANNSIRKQIRGTWVLDSILSNDKKMKTDLVLNNIVIKGLAFDPDFTVSSAKKMKRSGFECYNLGVYVVGGKELKLMGVDGVAVKTFQIDKSTADQLVLSTPADKKSYYFNLDLETEEMNKLRFGPNYK